ncbi:TolC family protein [bacterium]|nr:TolC family protein [bacterium]
MKNILFGIIILGICISTAYISAQEIEPDCATITLEQAIEIAMENNDEINALRCEVRASEAVLKNARANYMPNLSATGEMSQMDTFPDPETAPPESPLYGMDFSPSSDITNSVSFTFVQPISTFGLIPASIRAAKGGRNAKKEELKLKEQDIALSVIESFYGVFLSERSVIIKKDEVHRSELALNHAKQKFDVGQTAKFDVIRSEVDLAQARESLVGAKKNSEAALLMFQRLLGSDKICHPEFPENLDIPEWNIPLDKCIELAFDSRPDLKQLEAGVAAQNALVVINKLRPNLNFIANLKYADQGSAFGGKNSWAWFVKFELPLFDGGRAKHAVDEARGNRDALKSTMEDISALVRLDVQTTFLALNESRARIESSTKIFEQAQEALHMAEVGYKEGVITYLDLISTRNQFTSAELNKLVALTDYHIAYSRMMKSIGQMPYPE